MQAKLYITLSKPDSPAKPVSEVEEHFPKKQQAACTPSLPVSNWFSVLPVDTIPEIDEPVESMKVILDLEGVSGDRHVKNQSVARMLGPQWER